MAVCPYCETIFENDTLLSEHMVYIIASFPQPRLGKFCFLIYLTHLFEQYCL